MSEPAMSEQEGRAQSQAQNRFQQPAAALPDPAVLCEGLLAHSPMPYAVFGSGGRPVLTNPAYRALFGVAAPADDNLHTDELLGKAGVLELVSRAYAGETVTTPVLWYDPQELPHGSMPGSARWVAVTCTLFPLRDGQGRTSHVVVAFKDR